MGESVIVRDPEILSGTPVFAGTRVPVATLRLSRRRRLDQRLPGRLSERKPRAGHRLLGRGEGEDPCRGLRSCWTSASIGDVAAISMPESLRHWSLNHIGSQAD
nr:DUF433 domain-containing protein [Thiohalocapsa sp. ML1]